MVLPMQAGVARSAVYLTDTDFSQFADLFQN